MLRQLTGIAFLVAMLCIAGFAHLQVWSAAVQISSKDCITELICPMASITSDSIIWQTSFGKIITAKQKCVNDLDMPVLATVCLSEQSSKVLLTVKCSN